MVTRKPSPRAVSEAPVKAKKAPAAKKPAKVAAPSAGKSWSPAGPVHWGYTFTVEVGGPRGARLSAFFEKLGQTTGEYDLSGYAVVDDGDAAAAAKYFNKNRPVVSASDIEAQWAEGLDEASRRARLDRVLATPTPEGWSELSMLLATWPDDQHPEAAETHALARIESWPTYLRGATMYLQKRMEGGDSGPYKRFVRSDGGQGLEALVGTGRYEQTELLYNDSTAEFLRHRASFPKLKTVYLRGVPTGEEWEVLKEMPLEGIAVQDFTGNNVTGLDTARWWGAPLGRGLKMFTTYGVKLTDVELAPLTTGEGHITHVRFENARLTGAEAGQRLAEMGALHPLETLALPYNELGPKGVKAMFAGQGFPTLRALVLSANEIGDAGVTALARSKGLGNLRWLSVSSNDSKGPITAKGAKALAEAASLDRLHSLFLMGQPLTSEGVAAILASRRLRALRTLNASFSSANWGELIALLREAETVPVTNLDLGSLYGGPDPEWKDAHFLRSVVHLRANELDGKEFAKFLASGNLDNLETLTFGGTYTNHDKAVKALLGAAPLPKLKVLSIHGWKMSKVQAKALLKSPLVQAVPALDLMASGYVHKSAAEVFLEAGIRLVTSPEFSEYSASDVTTYDLALAGVPD